MTRRTLLALTTALQAQTPEQVASNEDFWTSTRLAFTLDRNLLNFNNGTVSPAPKIVQESMERYWTMTNMSPSRYVEDLLAPEAEIIREELAREFGCGSDELALTRNTSEGLHTILLGLDFQKGDEVVTTTQDYPSMFFSLERRAARDGIVVKKFSYPTPPKSPKQLTELFFANVTPRTKAILVSHMTYTTGQIFPLAEICREARKRGILTIVDGAHGFAHLVFKRDDIDCDFYATSLHKWLTAPLGTGFLYVRREHIPKVWPLVGTPAGMANSIRKFDSFGTQPVAMRNAIADALAFHRAIGAHRKQERLRYLRRRWEAAVRNIPRVKLLNADTPEQSCGIGALSIDGLTGPAITDTLYRKYKIHVRARTQPNEFDCIRVSPNVYSSLEDIDRFGRAIEAIAKS
ncbi:aminotransferase class V-fold PLP-dependent enzyme [Bryobacter aggregatus]|uniref:aminotransferase class V-fold PLP-dependent enzyme n=1 Tax=Bryobacter aggregatus TaxID=360054 RepID=UPI00068E6A99|nr:aminotransferase class V-fold PLP-dependent enzyme [Bryobacter aggregatus]